MAILPAILNGQIHKESRRDIRLESYHFDPVYLYLDALAASGERLWLDEHVTVPVYAGIFSRKGIILTQII